MLGEGSGRGGLVVAGGGDVTAERRSSVSGGEIGDLTQGFNLMSLGTGDSGRKEERMGKYFRFVRSSVRRGADDAALGNVGPSEARLMLREVLSVVSCVFYNVYFSSWR